MISAEKVEDWRIEKITDGLGFGDGNISVRYRLENPSDGLVEGILDVVESTILSPEILVEIDRDKNGKVVNDDGCGDGRWVRKIFEGIEERAISLNRPKIFGGGVTMATAASIGLGYGSRKGLQQTFIDSIELLAEREINFGAHTDNHASGSNCGCGAIDKSPQIIANIVKYQDSIAGFVERLGLEVEYLDDIFKNYEDYLLEIQGDDSFSGQKVIEKISDSGKVVKELADEHNEVAILLNMQPGKTVNQEVVRNITDNQAQVFGVDLWRMGDIADKLYDENKEQQKALLSMVIYTLGTATALTKGDLPVYIAK